MYRTNGGIYNYKSKIKRWIMREVSNEKKQKSFPEKQKEILMLICVDKAMDNIEALIRNKAIANNFIKDLNSKRNSIDDKLHKYKVDLQTINKKLEIQLKIVEVLKLKDDEMITESEAEAKIGELDRELDAFMIRNECEDKQISAS